MKIRRSYLLASLLFFTLLVCKEDNVVYAESLCNSTINQQKISFDENLIPEDTLGKEANQNKNEVLQLYPKNNGTRLWESHPLRVGIIKRSWPLASIDNQGNLVGLNPDVMKAVLGQLDFNYKIYVGPLEKIQQLLEVGDIDVIFGYLKTSQQISSCLFSMPYLYIDYRTAVLKNNKKIMEPNDLNTSDVTVAIGLEDDIIHEDFQTFAPNTTIKVYENYQAASESVYRGECDALMRMDCIPFIEDTITHKEMRFLPNVYYNMLPNTIAVRSNNKKLIYLINNTLFKLIENKEIDDIKKKYNLQEKELFLANIINRKMDLLIITVLILFIVLIYYIIRLMKKQKVNKETSKLLRNIIDNMPITVFLSATDNPSVIKYFNTVSHLFTIKKGKIVIKSMFEELDTKERLDHMIQETWNTGQPQMSIFELKNRETNKLCYFIVRSMKILYGDTHRLIITSVDNTNLVATKKLAELNDSHMTNYLTDVSFEIRTLLNAVVGFSQLIPDVTNSTTKEEYLTIIENKGQALNSLINDVLILSKLESGQYTLTFQKINLIDFLMINQNQLVQKYSRSNIEILSDNFYDSYFMDVDADLYQIFTEQLLRASVELIGAGKITIGFLESNKEFILYSSGNDNDHCKKNLLTIIHQTLNSNYFGFNNRFPLAICFAIARLIKAEIGYYHTKDNQITFWISYKIVENNKYPIINKTDFYNRKKELDNRWDQTWFELDENNEYQEGGKDEK
ncbi:MAG: transporter substrate-binding domain-containing protein [Bacteroidaceae bacterium]